MGPLEARRSGGFLWAIFRSPNGPATRFRAGYAKLGSRCFRPWPLNIFHSSAGLGITLEGRILRLDPVAKSLELVIDFERGARFADPETGELCPVHDTVQRSWEHLKFFEHRTTIRARVARITTPSGAVKTVEVPWARPNGGFTLLMEAYLWRWPRSCLLPRCRDKLRSARTASGTSSAPDQRGLVESRLEFAQPARSG